jgi:hypothetical protein
LGVTAAGLIKLDAFGNGEDQVVWVLHAHRFSSVLRLLMSDKTTSSARPELVALVRQLRRLASQRSLREISKELAVRGHLNERDQPFSAASINSMLVRACALGRSFLR